MNSIFQLVYLTNNQIVVTEREIVGKKDVSRILKLTNNKRAKVLVTISLIAALVSFFTGIFFKEQILSLPAYWLIFLCIFILICWLLWQACLFLFVIRYQRSKYYSINQDTLKFVLQYIERLEERHSQHMDAYRSELNMKSNSIDTPFNPQQISEEYQEMWEDILKDSQMRFGLYDEDIEHLRLGQFHFYPDSLPEENEDESENEDEDENEEN